MNTVANASRRHVLKVIRNLLFRASLTLNQYLAEHYRPARIDPSVPIIRR
jgi:hypothetical protein